MAFSRGHLPTLYAVKGEHLCFEHLQILKNKAVTPGILGVRDRIATYTSGGFIVKLSDAMLISLLFIQIQQSRWDSVPSGTICYVCSILVQH